MQSLHAGIFIELLMASLLWPLLVLELPLQHCHVTHFIVIFFLVLQVPYKINS